ncbi:MAG: regulatory iron-sulfur-containing complex subunit RicT, partial [candidate division WOR-3 bacterium]
DEGDDAGKLKQVSQYEDVYGRIVRKADEVDLAKIEAHRQKCRDLLGIFRKQIEIFDLPMKPVYAHYQFDGERVLFYFTAEHRVDFRKLHKAISQQLNTRVVIKQVGVRDFSKIYGGIGPCGRELCCAKFLTELKPITMRMAREQNLYVSSAKLTGACGKLICCLDYEDEVYREAIEKFPRIGEKIIYQNYQAEVIGNDIFNEKVNLKLSDGTELMVALKEVKQLLKR